jgi:hypothetical protein
MICMCILGWVLWKNVNKCCCVPEGSFVFCSPPHIRRHTSYYYRHGESAMCNEIPSVVAAPGTIHFTRGEVSVKSISDQASLELRLLYYTRGEMCLSQLCPLFYPFPVFVLKNLRNIWSVKTHDNLRNRRRSFLLNCRRIFISTVWQCRWRWKCRWMWLEEINHWSLVRQTSSSPSESPHSKHPHNYLSSYCCSLQSLSSNTLMPASVRPSHSTNFQTIMVLSLGSGSGSSASWRALCHRIFSVSSVSYWSLKFSDLKTSSASLALICAPAVDLRADDVSAELRKLRDIPRMYVCVYTQTVHKCGRGARKTG